MSKNIIEIASIYIERMQYYLEGFFTWEEKRIPQFFLQDLEDGRLYSPTETRIGKETFCLRFNLPSAKEGSFLDSGKYLVVAQDTTSSKKVEGIPGEALYRSLADLEEEEKVDYEKAPTNAMRQNVLLRHLQVNYYKNNSNKNYYLRIKPMIDPSVNSFIIHFQQKAPLKKKQWWTKQIDKIRNSHRKVSFTIRDRAFKSLFSISKQLKRKSSRQVLFVSDSRGELSGNFAFIYEKLKELGIPKKQRLRIRCVFKSHLKDRRKWIDKFRLPWLLGHADYVFVDDYYPLIYSLRFSESTKIIQLWHACGAFKTVGYSRMGKKGGPMHDTLTHRNYTHVMVSSENDIAFYAEAFGIQEEKVHPLGVPRTDIFFDTDYKNCVIERLRKQYPFICHKKVILFAPTFRGNGAGSAHYPLIKIDFQALANYCQAHQAVILFKLHPFVKEPLVFPEGTEDVLFDLSEEREVNDLLFITDLLITDYSSLIFEYATQKKPMLFYAFDLEEYLYTRDFYEPYKPFVPGKIVTSFSEVIEAMEKEDYEEQKVLPFLEKHFQYRDGKSAERIVRYLFNEVKEEQT